MTTVIAVYLAIAAGLMFIALLALFVTLVVLAVRSRSTTRAQRYRHDGSEAFRAY